MSLFENASNLSIHGGNFTALTSRKEKGVDLLRGHMAPGAFHNSSERYDPSKCHPETRVAVIQAIVDWIEDGQKTTFVKWLNGPAGAGKSAIAQAIAELYHKSGASLAYQLLIAIPQMCSHVEEALEKDPSLLTRSLAAQMESLIVEPLEKAFSHNQQSMGPAGPRLIVLDGLDECGTPKVQRYILKVITDSCRKFSIPLLFLIASRSEQAIRDSFNDQPLLNSAARLTLDERYKPDDDIRLFLVQSFASVKRTHPLRLLLPGTWPDSKDINQLVSKSSGQFIYGATVVKFVKSARRNPSEQLKIILGITWPGNDAPFAELDFLYRHIFSMVEDISKVLEILSCLFLIKNLGPPQEIANQIGAILSYPRGDLQLILIDLHSVLNVPDIGDTSDGFRVLHASLQDFFMDPARSGEFFIDQRKAHAQIARFSRNIRTISVGTQIIVMVAT